MGVLTCCLPRTQRVMPSGFLILQRFFLRVDDVVFRLFDVRVYCAFAATPTPTPTSFPPSLGSLSLGPTRREMASGPTSDNSASPAPPQRLIRECSGCEAPYKDVKSVSAWERCAEMSGGCGMISAVDSDAR